MKKFTYLLVFTLITFNTYSQVFDFNEEVTPFIQNIAIAPPDVCGSNTYASVLDIEVCENRAGFGAAQAFLTSGYLNISGAGIGNSAGANKVVTFTRNSVNNFEAKSIIVVPRCYRPNASAPYQTTDFSVVGYKNGAQTGIHSVSGATHDTVYDIDLSTLSGFDDIDELVVNTGVQDFRVDSLELAEVATLSIEDNSLYLSNIFIYPNPAENTLYINNTDSYNIENIRIIDLQGRIVKTITKSSLETGINLKELKRATYFLEIQTNQGNIVKTFIKQ